MNLEDDLIQEYLVESREHLAHIENDLLQVEQDGAAIDEQLVNRVFRAAHSIKGGAGFFNLSRIRELAHRTESVLDMVRSGQLVPTPEVVSVLLLSFDQLRDMLGNWQHSNSIDIDDYLSGLAALNANQNPELPQLLKQDAVAMPIPGKERLIEIASFDLEQARRGGRTIYLIEYDLIRDMQQGDKTPLSVMAKLAKCGTIIEAKCDYDSIGCLEDKPVKRIPFEVLYASALEPELIHNLVEIPPVFVNIIEKQGTVRTLGVWTRLVMRW